MDSLWAELLEEDRQVQSSARAPKREDDTEEWTEIKEWVDYAGEQVECVACPGYM